MLARGYCRQRTLPAKKSVAVRSRRPPVRQLQAVLIGPHIFFPALA